MLVLKLLWFSEFFLWKFLKVKNSSLWSNFQLCQNEWPGGRIYWYHYLIATSPQASLGAQYTKVMGIWFTWTSTIMTWRLKQVEQEQSLTSTSRLRRAGSLLNGTWAPQAHSCHLTCIVLGIAVSAMARSQSWTRRFVSFENASRWMTKRSQVDSTFGYLMQPFSASGRLHVLWCTGRQQRRAVFGPADAWRPSNNSFALEFRV